jgi:hypothetical protein
MEDEGKIERRGRGWRMKKVRETKVKNECLTEEEESFFSPKATEREREKEELSGWDWG